MSLKKVWGRTAVSSSKMIDFDSSSSIDEKIPTSSRAQIPIIAGKDLTFGTELTVKTLYPDKKGCNNWTETPPRQVKEKVAKAHDRVAIKVYKVVDEERPAIAGRYPLKTQSLEIQSPILLVALKDILANVGHYLETTEVAKFKEPFESLFFSYEAILRLFNQTSEQDTLKHHLRLLVRVMNDLLSGPKKQLQNLQESKLVSFALAWTFFPKGSIIYCGTGGCDQLYQAKSISYERPSSGIIFKVVCKEISFNGTNFDWQTKTLELPPFLENKPINSLPFYPLSFHVDAKALKKRLIARGRSIIDYQDLTIREYSGIGIESGPMLKRHNVSGRVLIDHFGYEKYHKGLRRSEPPTTPKAVVDEIIDPDESFEERTSKPEPIKSNTYTSRLAVEEQQANKAKILGKEDNLMFMSPMLPGFSLKEKQWLHFFVDDLRPVAWNDEAYDHLVYAEEQKDLVLTFVENHHRTFNGNDDVIVGKGQGLTLLLSGPPGTGKTLTAEAVADKTRRPLYYLQAEELGTQASSLAAQIKKVFEMATDWNAVILLDEADVFMAQRSPTDVKRNELVSIFLRELEYYRGIIFLTTNLLSTIDVAFRSRVHIHLVFSSLSFDARCMLWRKFLDRLLIPGVAAASNNTSGTGITEDDIKALAKWNLNGREIKNAVKTVNTWCQCKGYAFGRGRLEAGILVTAPGASKEE